MSNDGNSDLRGALVSLPRQVFGLLGIGLMVIAITTGLKAETFYYKDKMDRKVAIEVPVQRAVCFETYELVPILGVWDRIVGVGRYAYDNDLMKALKPDITHSVPSAGSGSDINMEMLLKLHPDVVITWTYKPEQVWFMEKKGLKVIAVYPDSIAELYDVMRMHGQLFKREDAVAQTIGRMDKIFDLIREHIKKIPLTKRSKVLWIGSRPTMVSGGISMTNEILTLAGGVNVAGKIDQRNADVSIEKIIQWDPDVVFIWGNAKYGVADILENKQWRLIKAVKERRVYKAPEWSTWSPRLAPAALWLAMKSYPEEFKDVNLEAMVETFYRETYGISYAKVKPFEK